MRIKLSLLLLFLLSISQSVLFSQSIIIQKESADSPSEELDLYTYNQAFFEYKTSLAKIITGDTIGVKTNLKKTSCIYIDYGPYQVYFYAEPGKNYLIKLPPTNNISDAWKRNPYFNPSKYHLQAYETDSGNMLSELNEKIRSFDLQFDPFANKQILRYYDTKFALEKLDSFLHIQFIPDTLTENNFYQSYLFYKKGILEFNLKTHDLDNLTEKYFTNQTIQFSNPAYLELFNLMFQSYFNFLADKKNYNDIFFYLATKKHSEIKAYLSDIELFNQESIYTNILLNEIYHAYYSVNYNKQRLLEILSTTIQTSSDPSIIYTSKRLEKSFTSLEIGYKAPEFKLKNIHGEEKSSSDYKGRFVYLGFCDLNSLSCMKEVQYLKFLYSRFSKDLEILYFVAEEDSTEIEKFIEWNSIKWEVFPIDQTNSIIKEYNVLSFPVFYLINKDGTILKNPAPNPSENFEHIFTEILRADN